MTTTKEKTNSKIASKKVLLTAAIAAVVASVIMTGVFVVYPATSSSVYAVQPNNNNTSATAIVSGNYGQLPNITGSINVMQMTKNIIKDNLKVSFSQAADIAVKQITNGTVVGGHLGVVQGYLVYIFFALNPETHTAYHTIIDAGNGKVLYTSPAQQIGGGGGGFFGIPGVLGKGFGPWKAPGGFMGGGGLWH